MKLQNLSLSLSGNNYAHVGNGNTAKNTHHADGGKKTNKQNGGSVNLSKNADYDKVIESIQEQIQKIQENEHYDDDTKKSKIEELQKQLEEIEKAKINQLNEAMQPNKAKKSENGNSSNQAKGNSNDEGVILELSISAKALIQADNSLKSLKNAHSTKVRLEGESNVLASEIKIDKGRGLDTTKKEKHLARLKEGVEKSFANMGQTIKDINKAAQGISESTASNVASSNESPVGGEEKSSEVTVNVSNNNSTEPVSHEKTSGNSKSE